MKTPTRVQEILDRALTAVGRARHVQWCVRPRYCGGSPAALDAGQCADIAASEEQSIATNLEGLYGEENKTRAERLGLGGIAYARWEKGRKVFRYDLLTGETIIEPPRLWHEDVQRLRDLRNRKQFGNLFREGEIELAALEQRAIIHRQEDEL